MSVRGFNTGSGVEKYDYNFLDNKPTKATFGLGNVDNTSDADKPVSTAQQAALDNKVPNTRTVNGKALSANVTIGPGDIAYDDQATYPTGSVGAELSDLNQQISSAFIEAEASGKIASFEDGADNVPVKELVFGIEPVQSGTGDPAPDNIRPITGWTGLTGRRTGRNILPKKTQLQTVSAGIYIKTLDEGNGIHLQGTANGNPTNINWGSYDFPAGTFAVFGLPDTTTGVRMRLGKNTVGGELIKIVDSNDNVFTLSESQKVGIEFSVTMGSEIKEDIYPMIVPVEMNSDPTYEPYTEESITVDLSSVVSGDTVYGSLNLTTGVLTVDRLAVDLGNTTWTKSGNGNYYSSASSINSQLIDTEIIVRPEAANSFPDLLCSFYRPYRANGIINGTFDKSIGISTSNGTLLICDSSVSTAEELTTKVTGQKIVARIEPQTYQLAPQQIATLKGVNNIWCDTGSTEVIYRADPKLFIEKLTQPTEDDMTADHAISAGTFFMLGNSLYLATSQIAAGGTITPGTNATKLSLADALNQLNT